MTSICRTASGMLLQNRPIEPSATRATSSRRLFQSPAAKRVGNRLGKHAHGVAARRGHAGIVGALEVELGPEPVRQFPRHRRLVLLAPPGLGERRVHLPEVVGLQRPRPRGEVRQLFQGDGDLHRTTRDRHGFDLRSPGRIGRVVEQAQRGPGVGVGDDHRGVDALSACELHSFAREDAAAPAPLRQQRRRPPARCRREGRRPAPYHPSHSPTCRACRPSAPRHDGSGWRRCRDRGDWPWCR